MGNFFRKLFGINHKEQVEYPFEFNEPEKSQYVDPGLKSVKEILPEAPDTTIVEEAPPPTVMGKEMKMLMIKG